MHSAQGVDFPDLEVDMKVTAITQPQSSCPFKSARQKIFGLGYGLLVFVYDKKDNPKNTTATLNILHTVYVDRKRSADYTMTSLIRRASGSRQQRRRPNRSDARQESSD